VKVNYKNQAGMTPMFVILILVVAIAIAAGFWFVFTRNNEDSANNDSNNEAPQPTNVALEGTMFEAMSNGQALECDWTLDYEGQALVPSGKFYTDGISNARSSSSFKSEGLTFATNTIITEDKIYDWYDEGERVSTIERSEYEGQPPLESVFDKSGQVDPNANFTYDCKPWTVDASMFEAPKT
jgi:hypothetical protein